MKPAWAEAFETGRLGPAPTLTLPAAIDAGWAFGDRSGRGVKVAILDSGIEAGHPDVGAVAGSVIVEVDPSAAGGVRYLDGVHRDLYGHGTACAGIIRALAPEVELYSVRVLGERLTGKAFVFAHGIEWCIENGIDVVNLSLSTHNEDYFGAFHELCDAAAYARLLLVCAMNNEPKPTFPSEFSSVFSVACSEGRDPEIFYANPAPPAEWGAPGIDVRIAWLDGSHVIATGNSFAAPVIAGHLARIRGAHPAITPWQAKTVLAALAANAV